MIEEAAGVRLMNASFVDQRLWLAALRGALPIAAKS
jgi:hypothetical protein